MQVQGVVESTYTKDVNTKYGTKPVFHVVVDGNDINCGFKNPGYEEDEYVTLDVNNTQYGLKLNDGQKGGGQRPSKQSANSNKGAAQSPAPQPRAAFPIAKGTKDISIVRQNSAQHASRIVAALINSKQIAPADVEDKFFELAYAITDFSTGHREENMAKAMMAVEDND